MSIDKFGNKIRRKMLQAEGYLLIELLIAVSIVSGVALIVLRYQWNIIQVQQNALRRSKAIDYSVSWLEQVSQKPNIASFSKKEVEGYKLTIKAEDVKRKHKIFQSITAIVDNFIKLSLEVKWKDVGGKERSFCIVTGVVKKKNTEGI